jgi:hypothetical protein
MIGKRHGAGAFVLAGSSLADLFSVTAITRLSWLCANSRSGSFTRHCGASAKRARSEGGNVGFHIEVM